MIVRELIILHGAAEFQRFVQGLKVQKNIKNLKLKFSQEIIINVEFVKVHVGQKFITLFLFIRTKIYF